MSGVASQNPPPAHMGPELDCPRCWPWGQLVPGASELPDLVCRTCHGRLCLRDSTETVLVQDLGMSLADLRHATQTLVEGKRRCPNCRKAMSLVRAAGTDVDVCFDCGASWYDKGELAQVSGDRRVEPVPAPMPVGDGAWQDLQESAQRTRDDERRRATGKRWTVLLLLLGAAGALWRLLG